MAPVRFSTTLVRPEGVGTWTFAPIPRKLSEREGHRSHQRVKGSIDGVPFASSLMPQGEGVFFLVVNSATRERIQKSSGDRVEIEIALDRSPVRIALPAELRSALSRDVRARKNFQALAPSHRKAFAEWVAAAQAPETRERRAEKSRALLREGKSPR